jgi:CheY-like chemotaxis protein
MKLLVVEDNLINQRVAQGLLSNEGAFVQVAENGQVAVDLLRQTPNAFDAVLMDMQMPVLDGLQATQVIRQQLHLTQLPIVAMTANAMAADRVACLAAGMNDHVGKPIDLNHLVTVLLGLVKTKVGHPVNSANTNININSNSNGSSNSDQKNLEKTSVSLNAKLLDVDAALQRLDGDNNFLLDLWYQFLEQLSSYLKECNPTQGYTVATRADALHALKGVANTIGAMALGGLAAIWERGLRKTNQDDWSCEVRWNDKSWSDLWLGLNELAQQTKAAIEQVSLEWSVSATAATAVLNQDANNTAAQEPVPSSMLRQLADLLAVSDLQALDCYATLRLHPGVANNPRYHPLHQAMSVLDFVSALEEVHQLLTA